MIKVYRYNQYKNTVKLIIKAPGGMSGTLLFDNGNSATKVFPSVTVHSEFWQQVIDESDLVKKGYVSCIQVIKEDTDAKEEEKYNEVAEVETLAQAVDYVANHYGEKATTKAAAIRIAHKHGDDFVNLK